MHKEFQLSFHDLQIKPEDLYELMGFEESDIPEPFPDYIESALSKTSPFCNITGGYKTFESITIDMHYHSVQIKDQTFYPSKIVTNQLKHSTSAALFICTAGAGISEYANKISEECDPLMGYVFDVIGSVSVEKAMDIIQLRLKEEVEKNGFGISDRYSPGYCEWSVAEQKKLFSLLPENFCNVKLSESSLMHPIKSISGIIGIGRGLKQKGYQCHWCSDKNCIYGQVRRKK